MKFSAVAIVTAVLCAVPTVQAKISTYTGDTTDAPTFNRAVEDFSVLSGVGTAVHYNQDSFTVDVGGAFTFLTTGDFDTFTFLYQGNFNPTNATVNGIAANDDLLPGFTTSGFAANLTSGIKYTLVTTGFGNSDFGDYSTTIGGPGVITVVPEPANYALFAAGLGLIALRFRQRQASND